MEKRFESEARISPTQAVIPTTVLGGFQARLWNALLDRYQGDHEQLLFHLINYGGHHFVLADEQSKILLLRQRQYIGNISVPISSLLESIQDPKFKARASEPNMEAIAIICKVIGKDSVPIEIFKPPQ
jgi:hypothetical protein